jgi:hypothetical protein
MFKIDQWHRSQRDGCGKGERGGSPGVVGRAAMAGTKGPGAVPAEALLDTMSSSDVIRVENMCVSVRKTYR